MCGDGRAALRSAATRIRYSDKLLEIAWPVDHWLHRARRTNDKEPMSMKRFTLAGLGALMVVLGTAGIILPLLPTTPFLLLAAYLFARSSPRWYDWLLSHKYLGPYITAWRDKTGLTVAQKLRIGISFSVLMGVSVYFTPMPTVKCLLGGVWAFWTVMLLRQKTVLRQAAK